MIDNMYSASSLFISILISYWIGYKIAKSKYQIKSYDVIANRLDNDFIVKEVTKEIKRIEKDEKLNK